MRNHGYQNYFNNEVLAASPLKLVPCFMRPRSIRLRRRAATSGNKTFVRGLVQLTRL